MKAVVTALGLKEDCKEAEAMTEAVKLRDFRTEIVALTGAPSSEKALVEVASWRRSHQQVEALSAQVAEMKSSAESTERKALLERAVNEGKVGPKDDRLTAFLTKMSIESLREYLEIAPTFVTGKQEIKQDQSEAAVIRMDDAERSLLRQLGVDEKKYIAHMATK